MCRVAHRGPKKGAPIRLAGAEILLEGFVSFLDLFTKDQSAPGGGFIFRDEGRRGPKKGAPIRLAGTEILLEGFVSFLDLFTKDQSAPGGGFIFRDEGRLGSIPRAGTKLYFS